MRFFVCLLLTAVLVSCAGSGVRKAAQAEFDSGLALYSRGQYEESIPYFERATKLVPEFWQAHMYLGRAYLNLEKWHEALPPLRTAFELQPLKAQRRSAGIIMDIYFRNASKIDQDAQSQFMELLKLK